MKAALLEEKNKPVKTVVVPEPEPRSGEVVVQVKAAALNHRDVWIQQGLYANLKYPIILGSDGAGVVAKVGPDVDPDIIGQEVLLNPSHNWGSEERAQSAGFRILGMPDNGTFAEYVKVEARYLVPKPPHLSFAEAAALPLGGLTAYRALFKRAQLQPGENLLITGIGGGVATLAFQFALAHGATVSVTSSDPVKLQQAQDLGAQGGANYHEEGWAKQLLAKTGPFQVILDSAGGEGFSHLLDLAAPGGRIAVYGATRGNIPEVATRKVYWKQLSVLGSTMGSETDFAEMVSFVEQHQLKPRIDQTFPLAEAEAAFRRMAEGQQSGKIVLLMQE